jgi:protein FrlC
MMKEINLNQIAAMNMIYQRYSFDYFLDSLDRLEIDNFEIWTGAPHLNNFVSSLSDASIVRKKVEERGKKIVCLTPEQCLYPYNIAAADEGLRDLSLEYFLKYIDMTAQLGCEKMLCCAGWGTYDDKFEDSWKRSVDCLNVMVERAKRAGVILAFEILCPNESNLVNDFNSVKRIMNEIKAPEFQLCIDTVPIRLNGESIEQYFDEFGKRICHIHITDGNPTGHIPTGLGEHPIGHYIKILEKNDYEKFITLEIGNGAWYPNPEEATKISFDTIKKYLKNN